MENLKFCDANPLHVKAAWHTGLGAGTAVYVLLLGVGLQLSRRHTPLFLSHRLHAKMAPMVPALALVGAVAFLADAHKERPSLVTCDPWGGVQWVAFLVHLCFLVRLGLHWCVTFWPQLMATVVDVWLFTQACVALHHGLNMYAFTFLTLLRFFHAECLMASSRLRKPVRSLLGLALVILVMSGVLQVAEEHESLYGAHPTAEGTLQPIRSFGVYVYWLVVTLSTVGYGEITPSTNTGRAAATVIVVVGVLWFVHVSADLGVWVGQYFREARLPPQESRHPRIVVLGESDPNNLARLLKAVKLHNDNNLEVILLVPGEATSRYLWLSGFLPVKVMSCASLQKDLTRLLPPMDHRHKSARHGDAVVLFSDHEAEDPQAEDVRVLQLLVQAREFVPDRRFIVQVLLGRSRRAVQQTPCWSDRDEVVCLEELSVDLLAQAAACSAAAPIISSLLTAPAAYRGGERMKLRDVANFVEKHKIHLLDQTEKAIEATNFLDAVLALYEEQGDLLLGWFSPETQDIILLPSELPPGVVWVVSPSNHDFRMIPQQFIPRVAAEDFCSDPEEVRVAVCGAEPGRAGLEAALHEFPGVTVLPEEEWRSASTVVVATAGMELSHMVEAHYLRTSLMQEVVETSKNEGIRFVADVPHGQGQRAWDPRTTRDVVSKSTIVSAVAAAILNSHVYAIWRRLAAERNLLGVRVIKQCTYGEVFRALLQQRRLLSLGVEAWRRHDCCITNPSAVLPLAPGDLLLCLRIPSSGDAPSSPPVVFSRGATYSTSPSAY